jgi:hypothetical protein
MIELVVLFFVGCVIVVLGLFTLFRMSNGEMGGWQCAERKLGDFIELRGLSLKNFSLLFSASDWKILVAEPRLVPIAKRLRMDRRTLALRWLAAVRLDVVSLWRLHRLLTAYGVSQGLGAELATTARAAGILTFIFVLRLCVFVFGPFAFQDIADWSRQAIETYSQGCRAALERLPRNKLAEFSAEWRAQQVSAA